MTDLFDPIFEPVNPIVPPMLSRRDLAREQAERARRRRKRRIRATFVLLGVLGVVGVVGYFTWDHISRVVRSAVAEQVVPDYPGPGGTPIDITIPPGSTGSLIGEILADAGVVASREAFANAFRRNPQATGIQPGTYTMLTEMNAADAVSRLVAGRRQEVRLTIPEGFTAQQIFARIVEQTEITEADLNEALAIPDSFGLPEVALGDPEGWLFPATYVVQPGDSAARVLSQMVARTKQELVSQGVPQESWEDVLNKASLVEREAKHDEDRPKMARAILNRLDQGMPLQIDAAVAYGLGISGTQLTRAMLDDPSNPYNTYQHPGLPPTPIANPGAAAIRAVVHPATGDWLFWVTVNLHTGETKFATTYAEHQEYVAELRAWEAENQ